jgi:hypothetical protein
MRKLIDNSMICSFCFIGLMSILPVANLQAQQEYRDVSGFDGISYSLSGNLEIAQGTSEKLMLKGDQDDLSKIITRVEDGKLKIYTKENTRIMGEVSVFVNVKDLHELSVAGSGNVVFKTGLKTSELGINLSGSGNIECMELIAAETEINLAGSGNIELGGIINGDSELNIAGSGDVDCENLQVTECEVNISGSGSARVWATDKLESNIAGSGNVYFRGEPLVNAKTSGSGSTKPIK